MFLPPPSPIGYAVLLPSVAQTWAISVRTSTGVHLAPNSIALRRLRRLKLDTYRLDNGQILRIHPERTLTLLKEDRETAKLRQRWTDRRVWQYGGGTYRPLSPASGELPLINEPVDPLRIVGVFRLDQGGTRVPLGTDAHGEPISFIASSAPVVLSVRSQFLSRGAGSAVGWSTFANESHLFRTYSFKAPSARVKRALGRNLPSGSTPDEVAWVLGWPPQQGSLASLRKLTLWTYPSPPPYASTVRFHNGRMVEYIGPGGP